MPEETNKFSSGNPPEEKREPLRPTIIGMGGGNSKPKPTVIGGGQPPAPQAAPVLKPTAIPSGVPQVSKQVVSHAPTAIPKGVPVKVSDVSAVPVAPVVKGPVVPTAMPGVVRKRLAVTLQDLENEHIGVTPEVLKAALDIILTTNLDDAKDRVVVMWGHDLQKSFSLHVSQCLEFSQSEDLRKTREYLTRMLDILESIDLEAIFILRKGALARAFAGGKKKIDSVAEWQLAQTELRQLLDLMEQRLEKLLDLKDTLDDKSKDIDKVGEGVEAFSIAALCFAKHLTQGASPNPTLAQRFTERSMSLTQTLAQIRGGSAMRETQIEQPLSLISRVQDVALVMVPGLVSTVVSLTTMLAQQQRPTVTSVTEISDQLGRIVQQLKGK